jgi:hypothetical protein
MSNKATRQLVMMRNEDLWPQWPYLRLGTLETKGRIREGFLYSGGGPQVLLASTYEMIAAAAQAKKNGHPSLDQLKTKRYDSLEKILEGGWFIL